MTTHPVDVARPVDAPVPSRRYVLVADDSAEMRGLLSELLERAGYEVRTVGSGGRALSTMIERAPDLLDRLLASVRRLVAADTARTDGMGG